MPSLLERFKSSWNAFMNKDPTEERLSFYEHTSSYRPDRKRLRTGNERSVITTVFNRIAIDVASRNIIHARTDENGNYIYPINSGLNRCLGIEANVDQTGRSFIQDIVMSMFDEGVVAVVPVDTTSNPFKGSYDIKSLRVGKIIEWTPSRVKINLYNDKNGTHQDVYMDKGVVAIIENPFYAIMNEPNSTLQRLIRKLNLLDVVDEQAGSGKLDLIIQLPYIIKTDARKAQAESRRKDIEMQLSTSKYGIAYTDGTERITQLNRPVENKLLSQVEYLTNLLYAQLGITLSILDGTADEKTMLNYNNRIIDVILTAIVDEFKRKFLTKTALSQNQSVLYFRDPFKYSTVKDLAEAADSLTRNEIVTSNELRAAMGLKQSADPRANVLANKNLYNEEQFPPQYEKGLQNQNEGEYSEENGGVDPMQVSITDAAGME